MFNQDLGPTVRGWATWGRPFLEPLGAKLSFTESSGKRGDRMDIPNPWQFRGGKAWETHLEVVSKWKPCRKHTWRRFRSGHPWEHKGNQRPPFHIFPLPAARLFSLTPVWAEGWARHCFFRELCRGFSPADDHGGGGAIHWCPHAVKKVLLRATEFTCPSSRLGV